MKRWHAYVIVAVGVLFVASVAHYVSERRTQRAREIKYEKTRLSYAEVLKTGMTRKQVEEYLSARGDPIRQLCCVGVKEFSRGVYDNAYDDLVKIGSEEVPFVCSENNVYIAFQFLGSEKNSPPQAEATDKLKDVSVYHKLDGCL
jgi:hypothetical protein